MSTNARRTGRFHPAVASRAPIGLLEIADREPPAAGRAALRFRLSCTDPEQVEALRNVRRSMIREELTRGLEEGEPSLAAAVFSCSWVLWDAPIGDQARCREKVASLVRRVNLLIEGEWAASLRVGHGEIQRRPNMRYASAVVFLALILSGGAKAQATQSASPPPTPEPLEIYQIDLVPSGTGFALTKPVLEGDVYVFKVWPDRATVRLPQSKVKKMVRRTKDINDEWLYQIDLVPSGQMYARDSPTLKGTTYVFHTWREGTLMSLRQADVQKVTRLTGLDAFKVHMQQLGATSIDNLPMGSGTVIVPAAPSDASGTPSAAGASQASGNWIYQGVPGVTDAWAPPSAVVSAPGDVPKAPEPQPHM